MTATETKTAQISYPAGLHQVAEVGAERDAKANRCGVSQREYPENQVAFGRIWLTPDAAAKLVVGDPIQVDRWHAKIGKIGAAKLKWSLETERSQEIPLCPIYLTAVVYV